MHAAQRLINHVALVLDASYSMLAHESTVPEVADNLIRDLALASEEKQQETRVSVYHFGEETVECLVFDMDVMRLPSIKGLYRVLSENTALIDATLISQHDLATTSRIYGEHAFLTYILTDGDENRSYRFANSYGWSQGRNNGGKMAVLRDCLTQGRLAQTMNLNMRQGDRSLQTTTLDNATIAWIVPNATGRAYVERLGAPTGNVIEWNTNSSAALVEVGHQIRTATETFMEGRTRGVLRSANVFGTGAENVNDQTVGQAAAAGALITLDPAKFVILQNGSTRLEMKEFVEQHQMTYHGGQCFYEWFKTEQVQPQKQIIIRKKRTGEVFTDKGHGSPAVREILGLGSGYTAKVKPDANPEYEIFVQSTAPNRKVIPGKRALVLR